MGPDGEKTSPRSHRLSKFALAGLVALYSVSNLVLFALSCQAWRRAKNHAATRECSLMDFVGCGVARWAIYGFMAASALICFASTAIMAFRSVFRARGAALDPLYIFRGVLFTLLLLAPIIYLGWSNLSVVLDDANAYFTLKAQAAICQEWYRANPKLIPMLGDDHACNLNDTHTGLSFGGLGGAFILEAMDRNFLGAKAAFVMAHVNILFGALVAAVATALAAPARVQVGVHRVSLGAP